MIGKKITVIGGPVGQAIDPVLRLMPSGEGKLAAAVADACGRIFHKVERIGNFSGAMPVDFSGLEREIANLKTDAVIFAAHLPNILAEPQDGKIRLAEGEEGAIRTRRAPKLVERVKPANPEALLVPFKLADQGMTTAEIVKWMLRIHAALAVYSRLGDGQRLHIIDALGNEGEFSRNELPEALAAEVARFLASVRRRSERTGGGTPPVPHLAAFARFSVRIEPAFSQTLSGNVESGRWPGNYSFRSAAEGAAGFVITRRNVAKTGLRESDFVLVGPKLQKGKIVYSGPAAAKPSVDAPVHRVIYRKLPWVKHIVHGHIELRGDCVHAKKISRWPCGAENEAAEVVAAAPARKVPLWAANIEGHGFIALIGDDDPEAAFGRLSGVIDRRRTMN